jgi:hypothetical protein
MLLRSIFINTLIFVAAAAFMDAHTTTVVRTVKRNKEGKGSEMGLPLLADTHSTGVRQKLEAEAGGVAYYAKVNLGGQEQVAVLDTGSFDVVVQGGCGSQSSRPCSAATLAGFGQHRDFAFHVHPKRVIGSVEASVAASGGVNVSAAIEKSAQDDAWASAGHLGPFRGAVFNDSSDSCEAFWAQAEATAKDTAGSSSGGHAQSYTCCAKTKCPKASYSTGESGENFCMVDETFDSITYGSGTVVTKQGADHIELKSHDGKSIAKQMVPIKLVVNSDLAIFHHFRFTTIFGIGPGKFLEKSDKERSTRPLYAMGIQRFTYCLDHDADHGGMVSWNDADHSSEPGWKKVPVSGYSFWSTGVFNFSLDGEESSKSCRIGCSGVVDTGSTLLIVPKETLRKISDAVSKSEITDCSNLSKFPVLKFTVGMYAFPERIHEIQLGPESYLMDAGSQPASLAYQRVGNAHLPLLPMKKADLTAVQPHGQLRNSSLRESSVDMCAIALDTQPCEQDTADGPEMILGMPLYHAYKVQFDLSKDQDGYRHSAASPSRFMHFGPKAGPGCDDMESSSLRDESKVRLRKMDPWKVAHWMGRHRRYEWTL